MSTPVELLQMLEARERRVQRQKELLAKLNTPLICFTMNIAGPIKNTDLIRAGFSIGKKLLRQQLAREKLTILHFEEIDEDTGNEACFSIDANPLTIKRITTSIEDHTALGRLFDMDVLRPNGQKVDRSELGLPERRCLICGGPARECARSRTHSVAELQQKTTAMLRTAVERGNIQEAGALAVRSLLYEVCTSPKPGLVDRRNSGSHTDMDIFTFMSSASVLHPYFETCCRIGIETAAEEPPITFRSLRWPGMEAEGRMLDATKNVNTHKGAIFSLGILCGALGRLPRKKWTDANRVLQECAAMTKGLTESDFSGITRKNARTAGQRLYAEYGITGVRGQAEAGFPAVREYGLPVLEEGLAIGKSLDEAGGAALLAMLCHAVDTNVISRSSVTVHQQTSAILRELLEENLYPDSVTMCRLDDEFIGKNLSPGGSADLLALCYMLHFLKEDT